MYMILRLFGGVILLLWVIIVLVFLFRSDSKTEPKNIRNQTDDQIYLQ
jgi:hypothetical protein